MVDLHSPMLNRLIDAWLDEDLGRGDLSQPALNKGIGSAYWMAKQRGLFCGGELIKRIFKRLDPSVEIHLLIHDGDAFNAGEKLLNLQGPKGALIAGERTALNLAMHLSGITTTTATLVKELQGTGVRLADTRKTTPGLRILEKYAVRCGGGVNHRLGLDDAAMLKENHLAWTSGITAAIQEVRKNAPWPSRIIVEAETPQQAEEAVHAGADGILLDEMRPDILHSLVPKLRALAANGSANGLPRQVVLEASGVNPKDLKEYAACGVDLISSSKPITNSSWIDFSMRFKEVI